MLEMPDRQALQVKNHDMCLDGLPPFKHFCLAGDVTGRGLTRCNAQARRSERRADQVE